MNTPGRRIIMTKTLGELFLAKGKILTEGEYLALGEKAPYRMTAVKKSLGNWLRAVEKVKSANPGLMQKIAEANSKSAEDSKKSILEQMAQALAAKTGEGDEPEDTE